jgi:anti-anti-sigma regulatory factor
MMVVYHESLPASYLLVLAPNTANPSETELAHYLGEARRSGKPAVWVDCRLLDTLSRVGARLLWASHLRLHRRGIKLVLCRVSECLKQALSQVGAGPALCLVPTLDDADQQAR